RTFSFIYVSGVIFSGWVVNLLWTNNYDNAVALSFLPAYAGVLCLIDPRDRRWSPLVAGLAVGILYVYPEMSAIVLGGMFLFLLQRIVSESTPLKEWSLLLFYSACLTAIVIAPFAADLLLFLRNQIGIATQIQGSRPGETFFRDLLRPEFRLIAFWGLGSFG